MREIFLGRPTHWAMLGVIAIVLWVLGEHHVHVTYFNTFALVVLALAAGAVGYVVFGHRRGERVTREPIE